ncbi:MAG: DUF2993 domain-containing protein [Micromonosporaceae bacterium]|nr:DUF2993 domain-containing protein [Micromonosporaceae bacterium]
MAKNGRKGVVWLMSLVALVGVLVLADRGAAWAAEDAIAGKVAEKAQERKIQMSGEPEVTVEGFPFLTQVFGGEYRAIRISMKDVAMEGITLSSLDVRATKVQATLGDLIDGKGDFRAGHVTGDATVPYRAVQELIGVDGAEISGQNGKLLIEAPFDYGAGRVTAVVRADVSVDAGAVKVDVDGASLKEGKLPSYAQSALDRFAKRFSRKIPLPALPYGLKVEGATVTSAGLVARASVANVPLS